MAVFPYLSLIVLLAPSVAAQERWEKNFPQRWLKSVESNDTEMLPNGFKKSFCRGLNSALKIGWSPESIKEEIEFLHQASIQEIDERMPKLRARISDDNQLHDGIRRLHKIMCDGDEMKASVLRSHECQLRHLSAANELCQQPNRDHEKWENCGFDPEVDVCVMMKTGSACGGGYEIFANARLTLIWNHIADALIPNTPENMEKRPCYRRLSHLLYSLLYQYGPYDEVNIWQ